MNLFHHIYEKKYVGEKCGKLGCQDNLEYQE